MLIVDSRTKTRGIETKVREEKREREVSVERSSIYSRQRERERENWIRKGEMENWELMGGE